MQVRSCWQFWLPWQCSSTTWGASPMEHIQSFTWSHWMPPLVECLHCSIAPTAAMVDKFEWNKQNNNKTQLLASNYSTFWSLVVCENFNPKMDPLISSLMQQAAFKCEMPQLELENSATFLAIKHCQQKKIVKSFKLKKMGAYLCP